MMFPKPHRARRSHGKRSGGTMTLPALDRRLWAIFSRYVRLRDTVDGYARCITCGSAKPLEAMDAGHFVGRRYKATRFDERNVNAQCRYCNRFNGGESFAYGKAIDAKYGPGTADELYRLSRMRGTKLDRLWYEAKIAEYTAKLKVLDK